MAKSPNWSSSELDILKEFYPTYGATEEMELKLPGRNRHGIGIKASRIGLKVLNPWNKKTTPEEYRNSLHNRNIIPMEDYILNNVSILHKCTICNNTWYAKPNNIRINLSGCPICSNKIRAEASKLLESEVDTLLSRKGYLRLGKYINSKEKMLIQHVHCGYTWEVIYNHIQQGNGCPLCNIGFGYSYNKDNLPEKATIYLFKISTMEAEFLKVGVTSVILRHRKNQLKSNIPNCINIELLYSCEDSGINILKKEQLILSSFPKYQYMYKFSGSTELLPITSDIELIKEIMNENI